MVPHMIETSTWHGQLTNTHPSLKCRRKQINYFSHKETEDINIITPIQYPRNDKETNLNRGITKMMCACICVRIPETIPYWMTKTSTGLRNCILEITGFLLYLSLN